MSIFAKNETLEGGAGSRNLVVQGAGHKACSTLFLSGFWMIDGNQRWSTAAIRLQDPVRARDKVLGDLQPRTLSTLPLSLRLSLCTPHSWN